MALKFVEITFENVKAEVNLYLQRVYNRAGEVFSLASPFGQTLTVVEELYQLSFIYLKNSINQFDLSNPNSNNYNIIRAAAIVAGHNPARAVSASGTLRAQIKVSTNIEEEISGGQIKIKNKLQLKNATNNLFYHIDLGGADEHLYTIRDGNSVFFNIVQGEWKQATYTGTGEQNQAFEINPEGKEIENFRIEVKVNGEFWELKNHLYEMIPGEPAAVVRTSFNGGLTVIFGNGNFGDIPPIGSLIQVEYVLSDGDDGNIYHKTSNNWKFIDFVTDKKGSIDFEKLFNVFIETDINFGADGENLTLMKNLIPLNMNNFVLALPQQYAYAIRKLGVFSHVNAYEDRGTVKIVATPNIRIFKNKNTDYFTTDIEAFKLDDYEKSKLDLYLKAGGYIQLTKKYRIDTPVLSYYVSYINLRIFDDSVEDNINNQIVEAISEYFLNLSRLDRIPKKDMVNLISDIDGVDSVEVRFVSKKNEDYHKEFQTADSNSRVSSGDTTTTRPVGYDPKKVLGIDPTLGDIVFESNEYPIMRGGWSDRNKIFYGEKPLDGFSSINIIVKGITPRKEVSV